MAALPGCRERGPTKSGSAAHGDDGSIEGRVTYGSGEAATPLSVSAVRFAGGDRRVSYGATDHEGRFVLGAMAQGEWRLAVSSAGDVVMETNLAVSAPPSRIDIVLPAGAVAGTVRDAQGGPAADVSVLLSGRSLVRRQVTDATGAFRFVGVPAGAYVVSPEFGRAGMWRRQRATVAGALVSLPGFAPGAAQARGRVIDHEGEPIAGVTVTATPRDAELRASGVIGRAATDGDGRFVVSNLYAGVHALTLDGGVRGRLRLDDVMLGEQGAEIPAVLGGGGELRGHVIDANGLAATGVLVQAYLPMDHEVVSARAFTDAQGRFALQRLRPGSYRLYAQGDGVVSPWSTVEVLPSARPQDYELKLSSPGATLYGSVKTGGEPVAGAPVRLEHLWGVDVADVTTTDARGHFMWLALPGGAYTVHALAHAEWLSREVRVGDEAQATVELAGEAP